MRELTPTRGGAVEAAVAGANPARYEILGWRDRFGVVAGLAAGDGADFGPFNNPAESRMRLDALRRDLGFESLHISRQVHGVEIEVHDRGEGLILSEGWDGHMTARRGALLGVTVADCVPVYMVGVRTGAIALLHAGWRGVAAGIIERAVHLFGERGENARDIVTHCGVSICGQCYEVGPEVHEAVRGVSVPDSSGIDLRAELSRRAQALGIKEVTSNDRCSSHGPGKFHSYRASGGSKARMLAYLGLLSP